MRRWQWWLVGLALCGAFVALAVVFWPKIIESAQRCCTSSRKTSGERELLEEPLHTG